jgi:hypothetical protein
VHGDIEYEAQRRSMSPTAIAHGSVLLGFFFGVKAWSYSLDRYLLLSHFHRGTRRRGGVAAGGARAASRADAAYRRADAGI